MRVRNLRRFSFGLTFGGTLITLVIVAAAADAFVVVEGDEAELDAAAAHALGAAETHAAAPHRQLLGHRAHCITVSNFG